MTKNDRILVVDDDPSVLDAYRSILAGCPKDNMTAAGAVLFPDSSRPEGSRGLSRRYETTLCERGEEGLRAMTEGLERGEPFAVAFVDISMPGIDGMETARRMWALDPSIKIVIVTAYSKYSPENIINATNREDLFFLRKPFDGGEIRQFARSLTRLWELERERDYLVQDLALAKNAAESANEAQGAFLHNVNHEFRNPLNGLLGTLRILLLSPKGRRERELLETAFESGQRLDTLLENLVDLSGLEAGSMRMKAIAVDLMSLVRSRCKRMAPIAAKKGLRLNLEPGRDLPAQVITDPVYLEKIIDHLIDNAVKFTDQGKITVCVEGTASELRGKEQVEVRFSVLDTGIGLPSSDHALLYECFHQNDSSLTRRHGGMGVGLFVVKKLVDHMGGRITAERLPVRGTAFRVVLPFAIPLGDNLVRQQFSEQYSGARALIVGDEATNRTILRELMSRMGMQSIYADSVDEAVKKLHTAKSVAEDCDIIFLDLSGSVSVSHFPMVKRLQEFPVLPAKIVVILSSQPTAEDLSRLRGMGVERYLVKPLRWSLLREIVDQVMGKWSDRLSSRMN